MINISAFLSIIQYMTYALNFLVTKLFKTLNSGDIKNVIHKLNTLARKTSRIINIPKTEIKT